jgi:predicted kinase
MPKCYQLIGVPGAGKSSWIQQQEWASQCTIVSTDNHVESQAQREGKTYNDVFHDYMPTAVKLMAEDVETARAAGKDIIWDQTSTTVASRTRKFNMLRDYEHIAVVFCTPARDELDARLSRRPGKHIPKNVVDRMIAGWDEPTEEEGFVEIWRIK